MAKVKKVWSTLYLDVSTKDRARELAKQKGWSISATYRMLLDYALECFENEKVEGRLVNMLQVQMEEIGKRVLKTLSAETLGREIKKQADRLAFLTVGAERYAGGSYKLLRYSLEELFFPGEKDSKIKELRGKIDTELGNELKVPLRQIVLGWLVRNGYPDLAKEIGIREGKRKAGETKPELPQEVEEVATALKAIEALDEISERAAYFQKMEDRSKAEAEKQSSPEEKALWLEHAEDMKKEKECLMNRLKAKEISN